MATIVPYFKILRISNMLLLSFAVLLGFWLSHNHQGFFFFVLLVAASICCAGFGNVVNDIHDIETDKISHPQRPLPSGTLSVENAVVFSICLAFLGLCAGFRASLQHGLGTLIPLFLLWLYAKYLKATPLVGNVLVSLLVAYGIIFGGIGSKGLSQLYIPASLAFLLNIVREIIKDVQDEKGDTVAGIITSASLSNRFLKIIIGICSAVYIGILFLPFILGHFGALYATVCIACIVPLHIFWNFKIYKYNIRECADTISSCIKYEMLIGLLALSFDRLLPIRF